MLYPDLTPDEAAEVVMPHHESSPARDRNLSDGDRSVRLPAQRRALADEPGAVRARRRPDAHTALSAGTTPAEHVHPEVVEVMRELGIDLADRQPQLLTRELAEQADVVVTMGCGDACPTSPASATSTGISPTPRDVPSSEVRATRDDIARRVEDLLAHLNG